jgi:hypothetical protein
MYLWHIIGGAWGFSHVLKMKPSFGWGEVFFGVLWSVWRSSFV